MTIRLIWGRLRNLARVLSPLQTLVLGFLLLAFGGALLLMLPWATADGRGQSFLDALFMATSAVSTTGLGVVGTGSYYTGFGQLVILGLVQVGGLGYMTLILFVIYLLGQKISYHSGHLMTESVAMPSRGEMRLFVRRMVTFTLLFEGVGALALMVYWLPTQPLARAAYWGVFHSISAFCTAGFALLDEGFIAYRDDWLFNLIINLITVAGAVGFFVLSDATNALENRLRRRRAYWLSVHTKLALWVSLTLFAGGTAVILLTAPPGAGGLSRVLSATFQSFSAVSTTGFNTVVVAHMGTTSLLALTILMFIGAPAGGTGGGIKTTTFAVIVLLLTAVLSGSRDVTAFGRRIARDTLAKSVAITITAGFWMTLATLVLTATEPEVPFLSILFETSSALGTVGLSVGLTPALSDAGKVIFILSMLVGRVGPLTVMFSLFGRQSSRAYRYPQEEVFVG